jgi:aminoglycoside 6'-N-acetyltransferase I
MIEVATARHLDVWAKMRAALWPGTTVKDHRSEAAQTLAESGGRHIAFIALTSVGEAVGFAEGSLRFDYVNGCETSPVVFLEGIYVALDRRREQIARELCNAVESWGTDAGCREMASDALTTNTVSHAFHAAVGFEETERVVCFRKRIGRGRAAT